MATKIPILHSMGVETSMAVEDGRMILDNVEDVEPVLEANKQSQSLGNGAVTPGDPDSMRLVARIPPTIWKRLMRKGVVTAQGIRDHAAFAKWLNDHPAFYASSTKLLVPRKRVMQ